MIIEHNSPESDSINIQPPVISIRQIFPSDLLSVSKIHQLAFPDSALTKLGIEAICRYYEWQLMGPHDRIAVCALEGDVMLGYCFAGMFNGALSGFLRRNRSYLVLRVASRPWLIINAVIREKLVQNLKRILDLPIMAPPPKVIPPPSGRSAGVLSIAVLPDCQGRGVGKALMQAVERYALESGYSKIHLTVHPNNKKAVQFYSSLGWEKDTRPGSDQWQGSMRKELRQTG